MFKVSQKTFLSAASLFILIMGSISQTNAICVRIHTHDFWSVKEKIREQKEFLYKYVVEIRFKEGKTQRTYTVDLPSQDGLSEQTCLTKRNSDAKPTISDISALVKAVPAAPITFEEEVDTGTMYIPAKKKGMKDKHFITKVEQNFPCSPSNVKGPVTLNYLENDDIIINVGNGPEPEKNIYMKWSKADTTQATSDLHDSIDKGHETYASEKIKVGDIYSENHMTPVVPLVCTFEVLGKK